jgi:hypothetical protein
MPVDFGHLPLKGLQEHLELLLQKRYGDQTATA